MGKRREDNALNSVQIRLLKESYDFCIRGALTRKGLKISEQDFLLEKTSGTFDGILTEADIRIKNHDDNQRIINDIKRGEI